MVLYVSPLYCYYIAYVLVNKKKNWGDARAYCVQGGGELVSLSTKEEEDEVMSVTGLPKGSWLGLNDLQHEGQYEWSDGSEKNWTNWQFGEPNGKLEENCVAVSYYSYPQWLDVSCSLKRIFVCEYRGY